LVEAALLAVLLLLLVVGATLLDGAAGAAAAGASVVGALARAVGAAWLLVIVGWLCFTAEYSPSLHVWSRQ
jgi:hypothetical protein